MASTLFILGRTPDLAFAELKTFFPDVTEVVTGVARTETLLPTPPQEVLSRLGGTVKIAEVVGEVPALTPESLVPFIRIFPGKIIFGISPYGQARVGRSILDGVKELLEGRGGSVRFVESREGKTLSSVVVTKEHLQELVVVPRGNAFLVGRTVAVQPFEGWGERDFGRPYADPHAGMLPPKVSRMVVNIADGSRSLAKPLAEKSLLDPFCGMGTVLSEGLLMGWNVVGSDRDETAVEKARGNLRWLTEKNALGVTYRLLVSDAVHVSDTLDPASIDAIVTEPYMGPTKLSGRESRDDVKNIIKGLEKLYIGCLRDWHKILKPTGVVMMALPVYVTHGNTYFVKKVIDMCEMLGYTIQTGPIEYSRPQAVVKRAFYLFKKK